MRKTFAAAALLAAGCVEVHDDVASFVGSRHSIEAVAEAARQCGLQRLRIGGPISSCPSCGRTEATLYLPRPPKRSPEMARQQCLFRWVRTNAPADLGSVITVD